MTTGKASAMKSTQTEISTLANLSEEGQKARGHTSGMMENSMRENGCMGESMAMEFGKDSQEIHTLGSGRMGRQEGMGSSQAGKETSMKVSGNIRLNTERGLKSLLTARFISVTTGMESLMVLASTCGKIGPPTKETS